MNEVVLFKTLCVLLTCAFFFFGMDIRKKHGSRDFVPLVWQLAMKFCSFLLIGAFVWTVILSQEVSMLDWFSLLLMAFGTMFITMAKRTLGKSHTFTGHYLEKPGLVTQGIYSITRNPLYFGVFLSEAGASLFAIHAIPILYPLTYHYWLVILASALLYAVVFNVRMARREANYLESYFGDDYRQYRASVPFLIPMIRRGK